MRIADIRSREIVKAMSATDACAAAVNELEFLSLKKVKSFEKKEKPEDTPSTFVAKEDEFPKLMWGDKESLFWVLNLKWKRNNSSIIIIRR